MATGAVEERQRHAATLRDELQTPGVLKVVSQLKTIPSLPASYGAMLEELSSAEVRLDKVAALVEADMGMAAKCLQLVNSAFFGLRTPVSNTLRALNLLGLDMLKSLVLSTHLFSEFTATLFDAREMSWLWEHSIAVSLCSRKIAEIQRLPSSAIDDAVTAGLLHETGKLVLASCLAKEYKTAVDMAAGEVISLTEAEQQVFGCNHAQVGAYLLELWGLSNGVVEAVAWHLNPAAARPADSPGNPTPSTLHDPFALPAVHTGCAYHSALNPSRLSSGLAIDGEYLGARGFAGQELAWTKGCAEALRRGRRID